MSLYRCDGCAEHIPAQKARLHCQHCPQYPGYDLCANCTVIGAVTGSHVASHQMALYRTSGFSQAPPPPPPAAPLAMSGLSSIDARAMPAVASPGYTPVSAPVPAAYLASPASSSYMATPVTAPSMYAAAPGGVPMASPNQAPPLSASWTVFFDATTWQPTACYMQLMGAIFERLDPERTGYITPEMYSSLLDVIGTPLSVNVWKQTMQTGFGNNKESQADFALKNVYDTFSIQYILRSRVSSSSNLASSGRTSLTGAFLGALVNSALPSSQMPLLTLTGFADLCKIDAFSNPDKACNDLNILAKHYQLQLWRERGDIPRWVLPAAPAPHMMGRMANAQASIAQQNQNLMASVQSMDESRQAANWIGQDVSYVKRYV